jgi:hypothetical protein
MNYLITAVLGLALVLVLSVGAAITALSDLRQALRGLRIRRTTDF